MYPSKTDNAAETSPHSSSPSTQSRPSPPTSRTIQHLSPQHTSISADPSDLLKQLLQTFHPPAISAFLFTSEPIHIPHFSSPPFLQNALLCQVNSRQSTPSLLQHLLNGQFLFLPAFNFSDITLGFGLMHGQDIRSSTPQDKIAQQPNVLRKVLRFMKDSSKDLLVMVLDPGPEGPSIMITACWHERATQSTSIAARFQRSAFLHMIAHSEGHIVLEQAMHCLSSVFKQRQSRPCPKCGATYSFGCNCIMNIRRPRHPFDFEPFRDSISRECGEFHGTGVKVSLQEGMKATSFEVKSCYSVLNDQETVREMCLWAVKRSFCKMGNGESKPAQVVEHPNARNGLKIKHNGKGGPRQMGDGIEDPVLQMHNERGTGNSMIGFPMTIHEEPRSWGRMAEDANESENLDVTGLGGANFGTDNSLSIDAAKVCEGFDGGRLDDAAEIQRMNLFIAEECGMLDARDSMMEGLSNTVGSRNESPKQTNEEMFGAETETSNVPESQPVALGSHNIHSNGTAGEEVMTVEMMEKRQRALNRRERNRMAAQRSNLRKKLERESMKKELNSLHEAEEKLREREAMLRKENVLLRELVNERDNSIQDMQQGG